MARLRFTEAWCDHDRGAIIEPGTAAEQSGWLALVWHGRRVVERAGDEPDQDDSPPLTQKSPSAEESQS